MLVSTNVLAPVGSLAPGISLFATRQNDLLHLRDPKRRRAPGLGPAGRPRVAYQAHGAQHQFASGTLFDLEMPSGVLLAERQLAARTHHFQHIRFLMPHDLTDSG